MGVIFLDIDGVLNSDLWYWGGGRWRDPMAPAFLCELDPDACERLHRLAELTGASLVISSSWRTIPERWAALPRLLEVRGVKAAITGATPRHPGSERWEEIHAWLTANPATDRFVILDDINTMGPLQAHLVATNRMSGLRPGHVERAAVVLSRRYAA